jgi:hypothetical protein
MIDVIDELFAGESISRIIVLPCFCVKDIIKLYAPTKISVRTENVKFEESQVDGLSSGD